MSDTSGSNLTDSGLAGGAALQAVVNVLFNGIQVLSRLQQTMARVFPQWTGTTATTATGGAATLPANPVGFILIVNPTTGATVRIPYYS
jgi:hypothetical protein